MKQLDALRELMRRDRVFNFVHRRDQTEVDVTHGQLLYIEDLSVSFDGFKAIDNLNFYLEVGELRCLIGPNGAGKTTMMDIITGKTRPDKGSVWFGQNINLLGLDEPAIAKLGIGRKFQKPTVFEQHTVFQNLELAMAGDKRIFSIYRAKLSDHDLDWIAHILTTIGLIAEQNKIAGTLSHGQKQWLEIGMLLMQQPKMLLVDEPVAGMTHEEMDRTAALLVSLAGEHTVVVVEHDMEFVRSIANTVTVLHQGSVLAEGSMEQIQENEKVREVYLGE